MKSGRDGRRAGWMDVMLSGARLMLLRSVLRRMVVWIRVRGTVDVTCTTTATACVGPGVERRQVGPLRRRRSKRGDVRKRRAVRRCGDPAARGVRREGRRRPVSEHRRRRVRHGRIVGPAAQQRPPSGFRRRRRRRASVEGAGGTEAVRRGSQEAATSVHHRSRLLQLDSTDPSRRRRRRRLRRRGR